MKKTAKFSAFLLAMSMIFCCTFAVNANAEDISGPVYDSASCVYYTVADGEATVLSVDTDRITDGDFVFPDTLGGYPVTAIGPEEASLQLFSYAATPITSITVPSTVTRICDSAFAGTSISEIVLPDALTDLGAGAFSSCYALESAVIPAGVETIKDMTFIYCESLNNVTLPENLKSVGELAFAYTPIKDVTISENVEEIGSMAFFYCPEMTKITVLSKTVTIGEYAVGFTVDEELGEPAARNDFTIYGYKNSTAESYAEENGIDFVALDAAEEPENESQIVSIINQFVAFITMIINYIVEFFNGLKK